METFIDTFKTIIDRSGEILELILNDISLVIIVVGVVDSIYKSIKKKHRSPELSPLHIYLRIFFGGWLVVALEFQLAADIVGTVDSPTKEKLIELAAVALIRTFLNFFLGKELKEEIEFMEATDKRKEKPSYSSLPENPNSAT